MKEACSEEELINAMMKRSQENKSEISSACVMVHVTDIVIREIQ